MHPLSCFWKLSRARRHIDELIAGMVASRETDFYRVTRFDNLGHGEDPYISAIWKLRILKDIPATWGYILGDAIGNMRAALDHALYAVVTNQCEGLDEKVLRRIQFPVMDTPRRFHDAIRPFCACLSDAQIAILEAHQPYRSSPPSSIALVSELANRDKHRVPNIVLQLPVAFEFYPAVPGLKKRGVAGQPVHDGQILATLRTRRPPVDEPFELNMSLNISEHIESDVVREPIPAAILIESAFEDVFAVCAELTEAIQNDVDRSIIATHVGDSQTRWERLRNIFQ